MICEKGTKIICPGCGHEVATAKQDINSAVDASEHWEGDSVTLGATMIYPERGSPYFDGLGKLHTDRGWLR